MKLKFIIIFLLFHSIYFAQDAAKAVPARTLVGRVLSVSGVVFDSNNDNSKRDSGILYKEGDFLYEGSQVFAGEKSSCTIEARGENKPITISKVIVEENSKVRLDYSDSDGYDIRVIEGTAVIETFDNKNVQYTSSTVKVLPKGTGFSIRVNKNGDTEIRLTEGKIEYKLNPTIKPRRSEKLPYLNLFQNSIAMDFLSDLIAQAKDSPSPTKTSEPRTNTLTELLDYIESQKRTLEAGESVFIAKKDVDNFYKELGLYEVVILGETDRLDALDKNLDVAAFRQKLKKSYSTHIRPIIKNETTEALEESRAKIKKLETDLDTLTKERDALREEVTTLKSNNSKSVSKKEENLSSLTFYFAPGKANLNEKEKSKLTAFLKEAENNPDAKILIEGYADTSPVKKSGFKGNIDLSTERALSVLNLIRKNKKINQDRISIQGFGSAIGKAERKVELILRVTEKVSEGEEIKEE